MKKGVAILLAAGLLAAGPAALGAGPAVALDQAPLDSFDFASKQRGAQLYVNYCIGCHSLQYMRYTRVAEDLGIPEAVAQSNLAFGQELFAPMLSAMTPEQGQAWFNQAVPPDLTLVARSRSADWLYSYMKSFYRDPERPSGWNNTVFANVAMPHPLHSLQGIQTLDEAGGLQLDRAGKLTPAEYDVAMADLVNFLVYVAEPVRLTRHRIGYGVIIFVLLLGILTYMLYRDYWRDIIDQQG
ncbi:MAG: cytochrome c1 [Ectothiorhodospiraceae bacterium AqS1]|nr:cytochrome c1 [Ectothiorhodospiraceae bacterium AqS1]